MRLQIRSARTPCLGSGRALPVTEANVLGGSEALIVSERTEMAPWREHLFAAMQRNATPAANHLGLPPDRTITMGMSIEL